MLAMLCTSAAFAQIAGVPALPEMRAEDKPLIAVGTPEPVALDAKPAAEKKVGDTQEITRFSFGDEERGSLLFSPGQIKSMRDALRIYEGLRGKLLQQDDANVATSDAPEKLKIEDLKNYPVFYLSSIAYRNSNDWSLWISGYKITPAKNKTDVKVLRVSADSATFSWTPSYARLLKERKAQGLFASTAPVKHRMTREQAIAFDEEKGEVSFTLKPNQTFAVGYFSVFEGAVTSPENPTLYGSLADDTVDSPIVAEDAVPTVPTAESESQAFKQSIGLGAPEVSREEMDAILKKPVTPDLPPKN